MKRKLILALAVVTLLFVMASCECKHEKCSVVSCTSPSVCLKCEAVIKKALGHDWQEATCLTPKTCSSCKTIEGSALGHSYSEAIIIEATCCVDGEKRFSCDRCDDSYTEAFALTEYPANEVFEMSKISVGEIITYDRSGAEYALGSGFVYSEDGKIITNYHVIEDAYSAKITIAGVTYDVKYVLAYNKDKDLAVLKIDATGLTALPICEREHAVGKAVFAFGSSKGLTATFSQGIITCADRELDGVSCVQHDAAISSGNSGGPLINSYGEVIGINTWTIKDSQNLNLAVSVNELQNLTYGDALTVSQFYEKECDVFTKVMNYIIENGSYDSEYNTYTVTLGYEYSSNGSKYTRKAQYDIDDGTIELYLLIDNTDLVAITIDEIDGVYAWDYFDSSNYYMKGTLYSTTFTSSTLLGYYSNNISYSSLRTSVRKLASSMVSYLCSKMDKDFSVIGVTAEDLGFYYF